MNNKTLWIISIIFLISVTTTQAITITTPTNNSNVSFNYLTSYTKGISTVNNYDIVIQNNDSTINTTLANSFGNNYTGTFDGLGSYTLSNINTYINSIGVSGTCGIGDGTCSGNINVIYSDFSTATICTWSAPASQGIGCSGNLDTTKIVLNITYQSTASIFFNSFTMTYYANVYNNSNYYINLLNYNFPIGKTYYLNISGKNSSGTILESNKILLNNAYNSQLTIKALDFLGSSINTFNVSINGTNYNTTNGIISVNVIQGITYNITTSASNYISNTTIKTISSSYDTLNIILIPQGRLIFQTYLESTGGILSSNTTSITLIANDGASSYNTTTNNTGGGTIGNITPGTYTATLTNPSYNPVQYQVLIQTNVPANINAYMKNGTAILFTYRDTGARTISGVSMNQYTFINGVLTLVGSYLSQPDGRTQWYATTSNYYYFTNTKVGYADYNMNLNPVLFTSYDIPMGPSTSGNYTPSGYINIISPSNFYSGQTTNFTIQFISPYNSFSSYQYNLTYPGSSIAGTGTSTSGETFTNPITITATGTKTVTLTYTFILNNGQSQSNTITYTITEPWQNKTLVNMGDQSYGMLIGDKVFWLTLILIVLMGAAYLGVGMIGAVVLGGILILIMISNNFITSQYSPIYYAFGFGIIMILVFKGFIGGGR